MSDEIAEIVAIAEEIIRRHQRGLPVDPPKQFAPEPIDPFGPLIDGVDYVSHRYLCPLCQQVFNIDAVGEYMCWQCGMPLEAIDDFHGVVDAVEDLLKGLD